MMADEVKESFFNLGRVDGHANCKMRTFDTGATRDTDKNKWDYEGFLSPVVLQHYAAYLHKHRVQSDGNYRDSDNWQKGIPKDTYIKSAHRHFIDWWLEHRGHKSCEGMEDAMMGLLFNVMGYAFEYFKELDSIEPVSFRDETKSESLIRPISVGCWNCRNRFEPIPGPMCKDCCGTLNHLNWEAEL